MTHLSGTCGTEQFSFTSGYNRNILLPQLSLALRFYYEQSNIPSIFSDYERARQEEISRENRQAGFWGLQAPLITLSLPLICSVAAGRHPSPRDTRSVMGQKNPCLNSLPTVYFSMTQTRGCVICQVRITSDGER